MAQTSPVDIVALNRDHDVRVQQLVGRLGDDWLEQRRQQDRDAYRALLERVPLRGRTLELGAGKGAAYPILVTAGFRPLIGLELLPEHALEARRRFRYNMRVGAMEKLPFPAGEFRCVVSRHSLEHTCDPAATLAEIWRVLRPGGYTAHAVPAVTWSHMEPAHLTNWWWAEWRAAFTAAGFAVVYGAYRREFADPELHMIFQKVVSDGQTGNHRD